MKKIILAISLLLISCSKNNEYTYSENTALKIKENDHIIIDSFGGSGPYKHTGEIQSNPDQEFTFSVIVNKQKIERHYPAIKNGYYISYNFENKKGDGYIIISKKIIK